MPSRISERLEQLLMKSETIKSGGKASVTNGVQRKRRGGLNFESKC